MVLLIAVVVGLVAGLVRSWYRHEKYQVPILHSIWLVFIAFLPQYLAFSLPYTREQIPDAWVPSILLGSLSFLFVFVLLNRKKPGMWIMGIGLLSNFIVIALNHGYMPLSPDTVTRLIGNDNLAIFTIGERVGYGKDILLPVEQTKLWFLSDVFTFPAWVNYGVAFSIGDIFISIGAFLFLWSLGGASPILNPLEVKNAEDT